MTPEKSISIFVVAGEASADAHAASLIREIKKRLPLARFFGVGGSTCLAEGMELVLNSESLNVVGITDWMDRVGEVLGGYRAVVREIRRRRPDAAVLLDLPDFNLKLAAKLKAAEIPVVYYISPQVWAWRKYRIRTIRRYVDTMLVVFPFEREFYRAHGVEVRFVGHPLVDSIEERRSYRSPDEIRSSPRVALLPGSRLSELKYHAPILKDVAERLLQRYPAAEIRVPVASTLKREQVAEALNVPRVTCVTGNPNEVFRWADAALVASGTATLEAALVGVPFALYYRLSGVSAWLYKHVIRYRGFLGMPNLLHGREVVREFFQEAACGEALFEECRRLLEDAAYRDQMMGSLKECRRILGAGEASARAAEEVVQALHRRRVFSAFPSPLPVT